ncbi:DNA-binding transcriptional regulator, MarR family [Pseudobutyrivibrio sp. OR37]|uniref:MarR family winged helix-turn-helix transcriptional regulator n=1 Tax=Pseudobutyrivibrio sp. OR37 TaxID=1798186 RepID=UPI0008EA0379|nr:MarR family winged helix-turn-helix transcriptional regulator [Pseudobutyrivibrio sp. OR37]SFH93565.1 DNA-binding transcriptional regulator, MarR family [Pseudobutyrivibrio sp. OR37]
MDHKEFDSRTHLGFLCDCLSREVKNAVNRGLSDAKSCSTASKNGWLLAYFVRQTEPIFQKDLEQIFHLPKSTLADIIQIFEKEELIEKVPVDGDGRKKQIVVTDKGRELNLTTEAKIMEVEDFMTDSISEEDIEVVVKVLDKMQQNVRKYKSHIMLKKED